MSRTTLIAMLTVFVGLWLTAYYLPYDDTDAPPARSGMAVHRDALTGCEYLRLPAPFGGGTLTPRLDVDGKQICRRAVPK